MMEAVVERVRTEANELERDKRNHLALAPGAYTAESRLGAERKLVAHLIEACPFERMTLAQTPDR
jgi:hypothetical protein